MSEPITDLVCIVCPNGCHLHIEYTNGRAQKEGITGNKCKRGAAFAYSEVTAPMRTVTSTVRTAFPQTPVLPVRLSGEIPRERVADALRAVSEVLLTRPVERGGVIARDLLGLGVDLIATGELISDNDITAKEKKRENGGERNMSQPLILTFDVGTQSLRAMLVSPDGEIVRFVQKRYEKPYFSRHPGWAEQEKGFYFGKLCEAAQELGKKPGGFEGVIAVTVTAIRDTAICLGEDLRPVRDTVVWLDKREVGDSAPFSAKTSLPLRVVGMEAAAVMQYNASVCNWIMRNEPEIWAQTKKFVMLPTYLNYRLTGVLADTPANMIGHVPFDTKKCVWQSPGALTRPIFDIPTDKLCDLVPSGSVIGHITHEASSLTGVPAGLPLIATGSDKGCETLGLSVWNKNQAAISFGSSATIQFMTSEYFEPQQFMPAYPAVVTGRFNPEIQIYRGYWLLSWFIREFARNERDEAARTGKSVEQLLNEHLYEIPPGCDGLILQPYWSPGVVNPSARGAIIGFSDVHTREHLYRSIIEGINFALYEGMLTMEKRSDHKITDLYVAGGGAQSPEICQITANMFGLPVHRIQTHEATGLGASMVAFVAQGVFSSFEEAIASMVRVKDTFPPNEKEHRLYQQLFDDAYKPLYSKLDPFYKKLRKLTKRS